MSSVIGGKNGCGFDGHSVFAAVLSHGIGGKTGKTEGALSLKTGVLAASLALSAAECTENMHRIPKAAASLPV